SVVRCVSSVLMTRVLGPLVAGEYGCGGSLGFKRTDDARILGPPVSFECTDDCVSSALQFEVSGFQGSMVFKCPHDVCPLLSREDLPFSPAPVFMVIN
ncbi:hypothetical protein EDB87DRAFT_1621996, partial [Lactarius vividus]